MTDPPAGTVEKLIALTAVVLSVVAGLVLRGRRAPARPVPSERTDRPARRPASPTPYRAGEVSGE